MTKTKSKAVIMASDGAGGMAQVHDRRFEGGHWPICFDVWEQHQADTWLRYLWAECTSRGWSCGGIGQMDAKENSGSITVRLGAATPQPEVVVVWERRHHGPLKIRAQSTSAPESNLALAQELFDRVNQRCRAGATDRFYFRGPLHYEGLPWRGELWLSDRLRLGPPSKQDETVLIAPRVILVDAQLDGIDKMDAGAALGILCRELSTFISIVLRLDVRVPKSGRAWTFEDVLKPEHSEIRWLSYLEPESPTEMPTKGRVRSIPLAPVRRPDFSIHGLWPDDRELEPPADVVDLWKAFSGLDAQRRRQFLQVASMWHLALSLGHEHETTAFAWMVVATEALKPVEPQFRDHNIYDVVEGLLGTRVAAVLRKEGFRPQEVRNAHLHRGEFRGSEFVQHLMMSSFHDPTFDSAQRVLTDITQAAIIEWLRRGGVFTMPTRNRRKNWRRLVKRHAITVAAIAVGLALGWLGHGMWRR